MLVCLQDVKLVFKHTDESSFQLPRGQRRWSAAARLLALRVKLPPGHGCLSFVNFVLSSLGRCDGLIPSPEDSYRKWFV